ncbi:phospholipase [Scytonema sp. UIC 10036]|uniref:SGNH/GDSL hydrolase family protein n=1 Tax=Scytonema sp. UIC 10036 TaxID=2304196 RepID=UPI0012DA13F4|nr:SGNH/GDSL hydrolase family protein [Scytonema sp. UIC 10036]MUH00589.1 phospholipase [Scytonema sp. UIC 10036]
MRKMNLAVGVTFLPFLLPLGATAATFDRIYVFGDSLSDSGNVFNVTKAGNALDPTIPIDPPSPPYFNGRYSNGPNWVDYLASSMGVNPVPSTVLAVGSPIIISPTGEVGINFSFNGATTNQSVNFAFGGATSGFTNASDPRLPGVLREVQAFTNDLSVANRSADSEALYIVWAAGSNDYAAGNLSGNVFAENVSGGITSLFNAGARNILVLNVPDLGKTPRGLSLGSNEANLRTQVSQEFNASLAAALSNLSQTLPGINLITFDSAALFQDAIANPAKYGFTNVTESCINPVNLTICANPNNYLFWDNLHPTTTAHAILGELVFTKLTSESKTVPEPTSSVSIGILGLAWLMQFISRRSRLMANANG